MLITQIEVLKKLSIGTKIYIVKRPTAIVNDNLFTFNLTANPKTFYPFNIYEKVSKNELKFNKVDDKKTSYDILLADVIDDIKQLSRYLYHMPTFIVTTSEREIIKQMTDSIFSYRETVDRLALMADTFKNDYLFAPFVKDCMEQYSEDWI